MLLGVSQWLSHKLKIDVTIIRAGFVIAVLIYGTGLMAYLILWVAMQFSE
ncbi:MAG: PspC domain-containing protein [Croceimicrobium sp.]|nr:PspC domain-containing protein [Bacteroidota bacterium]